ncbi:MYCBP-associated protein-like isoform X2 [Hydra vulgaris]|uniref:MYCBP-associated protein-like isoform X2 n=1 Tax=Hydra vulgaris TaxID=6087 RepID=A0ABM4D5K3_HYDVU
MDTDLENLSKVIQNANDIKKQSLLKIDTEKYQTNSATSVSGKISAEKVERLIYSPSNTNHVPVPPISQLKNKVMVRKYAKKDRSMESSKNKIKVLVAHTVNENDSQLFSKEPLKDYHVLGSLEEYNARRGVNHIDDVTFVPFEEKSIEVAEIQTNQRNALNNWIKKMSERKKLQKHLSDSLSVHKDNLVMGQSDQFRSVQEHRMIIERAMPFLNSGKGNRVGSEFWKQTEFLKKNQDISITLTKEEKGNFSPLEYIGLSSHIKEEMATQEKNTTRSNKVHFAWSKSFYFKKRLEELQSAINEMNLYEPLMDGLEVVGNSLNASLEAKLQEKNINVSHPSLKINCNEEIVSKDLLENISGSIYNINSQKPISGPSLLINGQCAKYVGSSLKEYSAGITIRLLFETKVNNCQTSTMNIINQGTTSVYFNWKKLKEKDPFGLKNVNSKQKFYFDIHHGVILPGAELKISFYFKSSIPGIFSEIWHFETQPLLCDGAKIEVVLRAISFDNVHYEEKLLQLDTELNARQIKTMSERIVLEIINGVRTPPRPGSPIEEQCLTIEKMFNKVNPSISYCVNSFNVLNDLYKEIDAENSWDFSISTIFKRISSSIDNKKEEWFRRLNNEICNMKIKAKVPLSPSKYSCCYNIVSLWVDSFVTKSIDFRSSLGLKEKQITIKFESDLNAKKILEVLKPEVTNVKKESGTPVSKTPKEKQKKVNVVKEEEIKVVKVEPTFTEMLLTVTAEKNFDDPKYKRYLQYLYTEN